MTVQKARGDSTVADLGHARCYSTAGAHGLDHAEAFGDAAVAFYRQIRRHPSGVAETDLRLRRLEDDVDSTVPVHPQSGRFPCRTGRVGSTGAGCGKNNRHSSVYRSWRTSLRRQSPPTQCGPDTTYGADPFSDVTQFCC